MSTCLCKHLITPNAICVFCARARGFPQALYVEHRNYKMESVPEHYCECGHRILTNHTRCYDCRVQTQRSA